jgi:spore maturation protein CgeB
VADVFTGWTEALRALGQEVAEYNFGDRLTFFNATVVPTGEEGVFRKAVPDLEAVTRMAIEGLYADLYRFRPHVLLCVSGFFLPTKLLDLARVSGTRVVILHTESPYEEDRQLELAEHADINVLNDPQNIDRYPAGTVYIPHAYRPAIHRPGPADPGLVCDFGFAGTGFPSRIEFLEAMDLSGLDVVLAGNWQAVHEASPLRKHLAHAQDQCIDNAEVVKLYRSMRVGMNLYRVEAERLEHSLGWAMGPREVELAACGAFFLRQPRGEGDAVLDMLPTFETPEEATELLRYWLPRAAERQALAEKARAAIQDRTFDNNAARLLRLLDKESGS